MYFKLPGEVSTQCVGQAIKHYFWQIGLESIWLGGCCNDYLHVLQTPLDFQSQKLHTRRKQSTFKASCQPALLHDHKTTSSVLSNTSLCDAAWSGSPTIYARSRIFIYSSATQLWLSRVNYNQHCEALGLWFSPCSLATIRYTLQTSQPWSMRLHTIDSTQFPCCYKFYWKPPHLS